MRKLIKIIFLALLIYLPIQFVVPYFSETAIRYDFWKTILYNLMTFLPQYIILLLGFFLFEEYNQSNFSLRKLNLLKFIICLVFITPFFQFLELKNIDVKIEMYFFERLLLYISIGLLLLFPYSIMKRGLRLQEENDLTI